MLSWLMRVVIYYFIRRSNPLKLNLTAPQLTLNMAPGTRPFRSVVGVDLGVVERNTSDEVHDPPFLEMLGLDDFARLGT